jgi:tripartite tricarboxylate transporter TctB family protein
MKLVLAKYSNSIMTVVMLAIFVAFVTTATGYPAEARFMPFVVGIPAIAIGLLQLMLDARDRRQPTAPEEEQSELEKAEEEVSRIVGHHVDFEVAHEPLPHAETASPQQQVRREITVWAYVIAYLLGVVLFGFRPAIPILLVSFLHFYAHLTWRNALLVGLAGALVLWLIFERILGMQLHEGLVTEYVLDWING